MGHEAAARRAFESLTLENVAAYTAKAVRTSLSLICIFTAWMIAVEIARLICIDGPELAGISRYVLSGFLIRLIHEGYSISPNSEGVFIV